MRQWEEVQEVLRKRLTRIFGIRCGTAIVWLLSAFIIRILAASSCVVDNDPLLPAETRDEPTSPGSRLVARIVQISDSHSVDPASPARFAGAQVLIPYAWRAWESSSNQILDGIIRAVNRIHASGSRIDFVVHTGDACDNVQTNELEWFLTVMDGGEVNPLSGPDDRPTDSRPPIVMDPYAPFQAQGLYRNGVHGNAHSIPWYSVIGNHETYCIGTFPIITTLDGRRVAPMPFDFRPGILLPVILDPVGSWTHGPVTPAHPGPPPLLDLPSLVIPVADRRFFTRDEFINAMFATATSPAGHGYTHPDSGGWYSVSPVPGLRLITLNTADHPEPIPGLIYSEGAIASEQEAWLKSELDASQQREEVVVVASHHPSASLETITGSVLAPDDFRNLLNGYPNVILHLVGHNHRNRVHDRGGYIEIETCSTIDFPQEARVIEIWRDETDGSIIVNYHMFSGLDDTLPPLGDDPLLPLRQAAHALAKGAKTDPRLQRTSEPVDIDPEGSPSDREGTIHLRRSPTR